MSTTKIAKTEFRSDACFGDGVREPVAVLYHEIFELGNTDIPEYILEHYSVPPMVQEFWGGILKELRDYGFVEDMYRFEKEEAVVLLLEMVWRITHREICSVLWLAEREDVISRYNADEDSIDEYEVSDIILSDLGCDGRLYAFDYDPKPVCR